MNSDSQFCKIGADAAPFLASLQLQPQKILRNFAELPIIAALIKLRLGRPATRAVAQEKRRDRSPPAASGTSLCQGGMH